MMRQIQISRTELFFTDNKIISGDCTMILSDKNCILCVYIGDTLIENLINVNITFQSNRSHDPKVALIFDVEDLNGPQ